MDNPGSIVSPKDDKKVPNLAVVFENGHKKFVCRSGDVPVLNNFFMSIQKGTIYSLLGSSGCGKTTVLSCIVGLRKLDSGEVKVFGNEPGTSGGGVGRKVGYMPQELSLYGEFTINEVFQYFGTIFVMNTKEIQESANFLVKFLDLPHMSRRVSTLSGGQKRRVSLAASLLHNPQLLILDEPTVGVDPLLRKRIWNYLNELVISRGTTVLITTHYIEEARRSHVVGFMRNGKLLFERSPDNLMRQYNTSLLEDVVLKVCENETSTNSWETLENLSCPNPTHETISLASLENTNVEDLNNHKHFEVEVPIQKSDELTQYANVSISNHKQTAFRLRALVLRNICLMIRNLPYLTFVLFIPAIQMILLCFGAHRAIRFASHFPNTCLVTHPCNNLTIGNPPKSLKLGFVNYDSEGCSMSADYGGCIYKNLSCRYLQAIPSETIHLIEFENEDQAVKEVNRGQIWGFITFPNNYSENMLDRFLNGNYATNETLNGSTILFDLDLSNVQIGLSMKKVFYDTLHDFMITFLTDCEYDPKLGEPPIKFRAPIYGTDDSSFREFTAPSTLLGILFFFPICSSAVALIIDKKQGTLDRSIVAGIKPWETMLSYFLTEGLVLLVQSNLSFVILILVFSIEVKGSYILGVSLCILIGVSGLSMGFLLASFCNDILEAIVLAMGCFFPNFLLSGMIWPMQGMPIALQYISYFLPCTLACESLRSIVSRGWGLTHPNVWPGFVSTIAYTGLYSFIYWMINKRLSKK